VKFMLGLNRWHLFAGLAAIFFIVAMSWFALNYLLPPPRSKFVIATGTINRTNDIIGKRYQEIHARSGITVERRFTNGSSDNLKLLNDPGVRHSGRHHAGRRWGPRSGIHVSPTFMIDGLVQADMSSGDPVSDWLSRLQKH
jgi:hypothetical protein